MEDNNQKEEPKEVEIIEETITCESCGKILYNNELCSCQKVEIPKWMPDITKEIPLHERQY